MGKIITLAKKDIRILLRDKGSLFWVVGFPLLFALFFGAIFSGSGEQASGMRIAVVDEDQSEFSKKFINVLDSLPTTRLEMMERDSAFRKVRQGKKTACVVFKKGFGETMGVFSETAMIEIGIDPARQTEGGYLVGVLTQTTFTLIQKQYASPDALRGELAKLMADSTSWGGITPEQRDLAGGFLGNLADLLDSFDSTTFDTTSTTDSSMEKETSRQLLAIETTSVTKDSAQPRSGFEIFFPSSLLWALMACAATFGVSIVKERTAGTFLRLRLAPIFRAHILAGKGLACFATNVVVCIVLIVIGIMIFGIRIANPFILAIAIASSSLAFVGIMMLISVLGKTEEAVGGAGWGILMVLAMSGGGMVPSFVMPGWLQKIGNFSPVKWGILSFEGGIWRDFTLTEMTLPVGILLGIAVVGFSAGVMILARFDR
jgi:ABC-2 type transport system permease protein